MPRAENGWDLPLPQRSLSKRDPNSVAPGSLEGRNTPLWAPSAGRRRSWAEGALVPLASPRCRSGTQDGGWDGVGRWEGAAGPEERRVAVQAPRLDAPHRHLVAGRTRFLPGIAPPGVRAQGALRASGHWSASLFTAGETEAQSRPHSSGAQGQQRANQTSNLENVAVWQSASRT